MQRFKRALDAWVRSVQEVMEYWPRTPKEFLEAWMESTRNFQKVFLDMANLKEQSEASTLFNSWFSAFNESCRTLTDEMKNIMDTWETTFEKQMEASGEMAKTFFEIIRYERGKE